MRRYAVVVAMLLLVTLMASAKNKDTNPADYPLTAVVLSVTGPNTESASGVGTDSHGNTSTAQAFSSTASRAELQIGSTIYLVGLLHECGNCIHRGHINLSAGETLHAQFTKDNQRIEILKQNSGNTVIETFDVKGSRVAPDAVPATEKKN